MHDRDQFCETIQVALDEGRYDDAAYIARRATVAHPADPDLQLLLGDALWMLDAWPEALEAYEHAARLAPRNPDTWNALAWSHFMGADFRAAREAALRANEQEESAPAFDLLCRIAEREGRIEEADAMARKANALDPEGYPMPMRLSESEFKRLVAQAVDEIPEDFRRALDGELVLLVEPVPPLELLQADLNSIPPDLLGLYVGTPLPERSSSHAALPDRVYLFQRNLEHEATSFEELVEEIRVTVHHELGHYFGFSDEELHERNH